MSANSHECDHRRGMGRRRSTAVTVCCCCRDFLCSICGVTIDWHEGLRLTNPGVQWRYCAKDACVEAEAAYHALPVCEMILHRDTLRAKRLFTHLQDRGIEPQPPPSDTFVTQTTGGGAQRISISPRAFGLDPGEACWCSLGKDCAGNHEVYIDKPVHRCGFCGQLFRIAADDPHWSTGRGPNCPTKHGAVI